MMMMTNGVLCRIRPKHHHTTMMSAMMATAVAMSVGWSPSAVTSIASCSSRVAVRGQALCKQAAAEEERDLPSIDVRPRPSVAASCTSGLLLVGRRSMDASLRARSQTGSIVEFHDPSHGAGKNQPVLGLVQGCEFKAKGGARVNIIDADGQKHSVGEKALHIVLPPSKKKEVRASPAPPYL